MMKLRIALASRMPLYLLLTALISIHACKNKKKVAEVTDTEAAKEQVEERVAQIKQAEEQAEEVSESAKKPVVVAKAMTKSEMLSKYFTEMTQATSYQAANTSKEKALQLFSNPNAPVLIAIYQSGGEVDYDEPTTISKYLDYLKDTKSKPALVEEMVMDDAGKIKELVLRKE